MLASFMHFSNAPLALSHEHVSSRAFAQPFAASLLTCFPSVLRSAGGLSLLISYSILSFTPTFISYHPGGGPSRLGLYILFNRSKSPPLADLQMLFGGTVERTED